MQPTFEKQRAKFVNFSRSDVNPQSIAPLYMNDKINPIIMECTRDGDSGGKFQMCQFTDKHQQKILVHKIAFISIQSNNARSTTYPHPKGDIVTKTEFGTQGAECELFGLTETGLTINCKNILKDSKPFDLY